MYARGKYKTIASSNISFEIGSMIFLNVARLGTGSCLFFMRMSILLAAVPSEESRSDEVEAKD